MDSAPFDTYMGLVRELIQTSSERLIAELSEGASAFRTETLEQTQDQIATLRSENSILRGRLADAGGVADSGGTGDMPQLRAVAANSLTQQPPKKAVISEPPGHADVMTIETIEYFDDGGDNYSGQNASALRVSLPEQHGIETGDYYGDMDAAISTVSKGKKKKKDKDKEGDKDKEPARQSVVVGKSKAVFADASEMKDKIRQAVLKKEYNVMDFYKTKGLPQKIARSTPFDIITLSVIAFNALWIWIDTDYNDSETLLDAHPVFQIAEHFFCAYFFGEWLIRYLSFEVKRNGLKDAWFVFDSLLVGMMVAETWVMNAVLYLAAGGSGGGPGLDTSVLKMVRLVRLTRMARMARLLRALPELLILIKGIVVASRSVGFTLALLLLITYIFAIVLVQLVDEDALITELYFGTVPESMLSLVLDGVLPDQAQIVRDCGDENYGFGLIVLIYILMASLTVMNMLIGVLCEVVSVVSAVEKEQLTVSYVKSQLMDMFHNIDDNNSASVSKEEFEALLVRPAAARIIQEIGVDVIGLVDFADYIFKDDDVELNFADFMELILQLRGSNVATVKDMVDLRRVLLGEVEKLVSITKTTGDSLVTMRSSLASVQQQVCLHDQVTPVMPVKVATNDVQDNSWSHGAKNRNLSPSNAAVRPRPATTGARPQGGRGPSPNFQQPLKGGRPGTAIGRGPPLPALPDKLWQEDVTDDDTIWPDHAYVGRDGRGGYGGGGGGGGANRPRSGNRSNARNQPKGVGRGKAWEDS